MLKVSSVSRPEKAGRKKRSLEAAKVMKPCSELNVRAALYWVLLGSGAGRRGAGNGGVWVGELRLGDAPVGEGWSRHANAVIQAGHRSVETVPEWRGMGCGHTGSVPCREDRARMVASFREWAS